jgi:hypothetical protein
MAWIMRVEQLYICIGRRFGLWLWWWLDLWLTRFSGNEFQVKATTQFSFLLVLLAVAGCTTMDRATKARGTGDKITYQASFDQVWSAMPDVIKAVGLQYLSADRDEHMFLAKRGITFSSWGENVAIFVEKVSDSETCVEVISKKVVVTNIAARNWEWPIFAELNKKFIWRIQSWSQTDFNVAH